MHTWSATELRTFLVSAEGERLYPALLMAATTGMRRGEVLGLRWENVDLEDARASVRQVLTSVNYELGFGEPKTAKGRRVVDLDPTTVAGLRSHRAARLRSAWPG